MISSSPIVPFAVSFLLLCVLAPMAIDIGMATPITLQSMLVIGLPMAVGWRAGTLAVVFYLVAGALGLPVFAGGRGGLDVFFGPTGGFLLGFVVVAALAGSWSARAPRHYLGRLTVFLGAHAVLLAIGTAGLFAAGLAAADIGGIATRLLPGLLLKSAAGAGLILAWERVQR